MENLKTHKKLANHLELVKKITSENELLKHIIKTLKDENVKLTTQLMKNNSKNKEYENRLINNFYENNNQRMNQEIFNSFRNKIAEMGKHRMNNQETVEDINNMKELIEKFNLDKKSHVKKVNNIEKIKVPKILFIFHKKNIL